MGYQVVIFKIIKQGEGMDALDYVGRLCRGRPVIGKGTYYPHPSAASRAAESWLKKAKPGRWRLECWDMNGITKQIWEKRV